MGPKVAISYVDYPDTDIEESVFDDIDGTVVVGQAEDEEELIELARDADALLVEYADVTEDVFEELDQLKVISRTGIGVDNIDVDAATERGIAVTNVPSYCEEEVATHTLALLLSVVRKTAQYTAAIKAGTWDWKIAKPIRPISGNTIGFVAYGKIPRTVTELATGFDWEYLAYDPYIDDEDLRDQPVEKVDFDTLLESSDVVSIHAPLVEGTRSLFDREAFESMRDEAILINTARGPIVDEDALHWALREGQIAGAGLDVMCDEPVSASPLFELDALVVTPHVAWYSERSMTELRRKAAENIVAILRGETPHGLINEGYEK